MINAIIILLGIIAIALFAVDVLMISKQNKILNDLLEQKNKEECELSQFYENKRVNKYDHDSEKYKTDVKKKTRRNCRNNSRQHEGRARAIHQEQHTRHSRGQRMTITYFGIILTPLVERIKFIKSKSPVTRARSLQANGREVAYTCLRQRHEVPTRPNRANAWYIIRKPQHAGTWLGVMKNKIQYYSGTAG